MLPPGWNADEHAAKVLAMQDRGADGLRDDVVRPLFRDQRGAVLERFDAAAKAVDRDKLEALLNTIIADLEASADDFESAYEEAAREELRAAATDAGVSLGMNPDEAFSIFNEAATRWARERSGRLIRDINATTGDALRGIFARGLEDGSSLEMLRGQVEEAFTTWETGDDVESTRAMRIARTETVAAQNAGILEGYDASGVVVGKTWQALGDGATRASHQALDGTTVGLDSSFPNGLQFPGDPSGPASEIVNCRCTLLPAIEGQ